jgi:soluble lytic murein transglycosylase
VILFSLGLAVLAAAPGASAAPPAAPTPHTYWIQAFPETPAESSLREIAGAAPTAGARTTVARLVQLSEAHPGTPASGLARLTAAWTLTEDGRGSDAVPHLRHPDIARTALADHAALALARGSSLTDPVGAAAAYEAIAQSFPDSPLVCAALIEGAEAFERAKAPSRALPLLERALGACAGSEPRILLATARNHEQKREVARAAATYDRLSHDYPLSDQADDADRKLRSLHVHLPPEAVGVRGARALKKALALFDADRTSSAAALFRRLLLVKDLAESHDLIRVRLGRCLIDRRQWREADSYLKLVPETSPQAAEAAYFRAKVAARRRESTTEYEEVARRFKGSPWAEEALLSLASHYLKDALLLEAQPYLVQILTDYPEGRYMERASWWVGLAEYRAGRFERAAILLEAGARRGTTNFTPGLLFWSGLSRVAQGETERGRTLLQETVRRYKHAYHGRRAAEALARLPPSAVPPPPLLRPQNPNPTAEIPAARLQRIRQLLLVERLEEAALELKLQPATSASQATIAWIHHRLGRLRPAINLMKRAYPEYIGEAGDALPIEVLRVLYPLHYRESLEAKARSRGLDPAVVAALICQESTFDAGARSSAGARGLMQIMPQTGRSIARLFGVRFKTQSLHNPEVSLEFGTRYLRDMSDRFGGRIERALAAYNAGPHRVDAWTATRPDVSAEEFVETIPFTETRGYVTSILAMTERYRRIYSLGAVPGGS